MGEQNNLFHQPANILWFKEISSTMFAMVGGKGFNLAKLKLAQNLLVPDGFCVTTQAFSRWLNEPIKRKEKLRQMLQPAVNADQASAEIRTFLEADQFPEWLSHEILAAYHQLECPYVAVRSSATAEDLQEASFAGQQDTFLNVYGNTALIQAVLHCWSSLYSARAITYREIKNFDHQNILMSVVVQKMVNADKSGTVFTTHPVTGLRDQMVIEAGYGLGESLVSGEITPDTYIINKNTLAIEQFFLGDKAKILVPNPAGGCMVKKIDEQQQNAEILNQDELNNLIKHALMIENIFDKPQDIEWAIKNEQLYILQTRPITTLA